MKKIRVVKDGDDTCWYCRHNYYLADWACGHLIARVLGVNAPPPHEYLQLQKKIERGAMKERGYRFTQFEDAWIETYRQLAMQSGIPYSSAVAANIFYEAAYVKRATYPAIPDVYSVLHEVRTLAESIHLLTLGDHDFQMERKVKPNALEPLFDSVHITELDKGLVMKELADPSVITVMVGDNYVTDMEPALALGIVPVWIHNTSLWTQSDNGLDTRVRVIHDLRELPDLLRTIAAEGR